MKKGIRNILGVVIISGVLLSGCSKTTNKDKAEVERDTIY